MIAGHVFLVGMTGSGKTSLGQKVAENLSLPFVDTDERVGHMLQMSAEEVLKHLGEAIYHNAETGVLIDLVDAPCAIVSVGEEMPLQKENVQLMQNHGTIIHIDRPLDQLLADTRFRARNTKYLTEPEEVIRKYNHQIGFYRACADHTFHNDHGLALGIQGLTDMVVNLR